MTPPAAGINASRETAEKLATGNDDFPSASPTSHTETTSKPIPPPDVGLQAYVQILGGFCLMFNAWGLVLAYGTFQSYVRMLFAHLLGRADTHLSMKPHLLHHSRLRLPLLHGSAAYKLSCSYSTEGSVVGYSMLGICGPFC
jgi:hypothetical protein